MLNSVYQDLQNGLYFSCYATFGQVRHFEGTRDTASEQYIIQTPAEISTN